MERPTARLLANAAGGSSGGSTASYYTAACVTTPATTTFYGYGTASPIIVTGLTNGTAYSCSVTATSAVGTSTASSAASPASPMAPSGAATGYTLSGPLGGTTGTTSSNFTVTPNGTFTGTVTVTPSGGGLSSPVTLSFNNSFTPQTFSITPTAIGPVTLTPTNSGGLTDAAALTYATQPAQLPAPTATAGNGSISLAFTAETTSSGAAVDYYTGSCVSTTGGTVFFAQGVATPIVVTGLTNGVSYTCSVTATNWVGTSAVSPASNAATPVAPVSVPGAPVLLSASAGNGTAALQFAAPASNGGTAVLRYSATCTAGVNSLPASGPGSPLTVAGLANGTTYLCSVTATNAVGTGPASTAASVTPIGPPPDLSQPPTQPQNVTVTAGNGSITLSFTAPSFNGGAAITGYTALCVPGQAIAMSSTSPITISGLTNGTAYTCQVAASNSAGTGLWMTVPGTITPVGPASAPQNVSIMAGNGSATVAFSAPANNGGSAVTGYTVNCSPGGVKATGVGSPIVVTGLTNGTTYNCSVAAVTGAGTGAAFAIPTTVTPIGISVSNGASYQSGMITPGSLGSLFGQNLVAGTVAAPQGNLPTSLGGAMLMLVDSSNQQIPLPLYFVSPGQINFVVPGSAQVGTGMLVLNVSGSALTTPIAVGAVHPGLFSASQSGVGPAVANVQYVNSDGTSTYGATVQCGTQCTATPLTFAAPNQRVFLSFYGTGFRNPTSLNGVQVTANGAPLTVLFAGAQTAYPGLDQLNVELPRSLAGSGMVTIQVTVDGQAANPVTILMQ